MDAPDTLANPATGARLTLVPHCMLEEVQDAIQGAREAFPSWPRYPRPNECQFCSIPPDVGRIGFLVAASQDSRFLRLASNLLGLKSAIRDWRMATDLLANSIP